MTPPRTYRIPEGMFTIARDYAGIYAAEMGLSMGSELRLRCSACMETVPLLAQPDAAGFPVAGVTELTGTCRQHEIAKHSQWVTWPQFCQGYRYQDWRPCWPPWDHVRAGWPEPKSRDFEWLDEPECSAEPTSVVVRKPELILKWEQSRQQDQVPA